MRGCFDTLSIAFLYTICNSSFLPFSENLCKENLPALDKGLLIIFTDKNHRVIRRILRVYGNGTADSLLTTRPLLVVDTTVV